MDDGERRKRGFHDGAEPFKTFDFAIESAVGDGKKASIPPRYREGTFPGFLPRRRTASEGHATVGKKPGTYPGRRFALPWAISFCPFGAGKQKNPHRAGTVPGFLSIGSLGAIPLHFWLPTANTRRDLPWDRTGIGANLGASGLAAGALGGRLRMSASLAKNAGTVPG